MYTLSRAPAVRLHSRKRRQGTAAGARQHKMQAKRTARSGVPQRRSGACAPM
jgi:hypothetical protein